MVWMNLLYWMLERNLKLTNSKLPQEDLFCLEHYHRPRLVRFEERPGQTGRIFENQSEIDE